MRQKGVVVEREGSRLVIECDHEKHWKLKHVRNNPFYSKDSNAPKTFKRERMPKIDTIVRVIHR